MRERMKGAVLLAGSLLAIAIATEDAVAGVDPILLRAAGTLGIRGPRFHLGVLLPAALPGILTGLKLGWSFAWRALMAGALGAPRGDLSHADPPPRPPRRGPGARVQPFPRRRPAAARLLPERDARP